MIRANDGRADLLVLPEGIIARDPADPDFSRKHAQALDGPFMAKLLEASTGSALTVTMCIHVPTAGPRASNVLVAIQGGRIIGQYRKLHLYDAFVTKESLNVEPGNEIPDLIEVGGLKVGLMTCYDVRFPEMARRLVLDGAEVLVLPSAWVKGPLKEAHWEVMITARALENTCYVLAAGECGPRNIGLSMAVDPLGVAVARATEGPGLVFVDVEPARIEQARRELPVLANRRFEKPQLRAAAF
jgi:predicted amidohydrolase